MGVVINANVATFSGSALGYGNPQTLITAYMETLLKLNKVKGNDISG